MFTVVAEHDRLREYFLWPYCHLFVHTASIATGVCAFAQTIRWTTAIFLEEVVRPEAELLLGRFQQLKVPPTRLVSAAILASASDLICRRPLFEASAQSTAAKRYLRTRISFLNRWSLLGRALQALFMGRTLCEDVNRKTEASAFNHTIHIHYHSSAW